MKKWKYYLIKKLMIIKIMYKILLILVVVVVVKNLNKSWIIQ